MFAHFSDDVIEFVRLLEKHGVDWVLVGGNAVIYHGHARVTGDVDFFYDPGTPNVARLVAALSEFWGGDLPADARERLGRPRTIVQFGRPPNRIDLLASISGVTFGEVCAGAEAIKLAGMNARVIGVRELIANKKAAGRHKDLADLEFLAPLAGRDTD